MRNLLCFVAMALCIATAAQATPIVDQDNPPVTTGFCTGYCHWYQNVFAGVTGTLSSIDVWATGGTLSIYDGTATSLGALRFSGSLASAIYTSPFNVDVSSAGIALSAGQSFVFMITGGSTLRGSSTSYNGPNNLWLSYSAALPTNNYGSYSLGFRTYMEAGSSSVPAPGALALLGLGLLGAGVMRRRIKA